MESAGSRIVVSVKSVSAACRGDKCLRDLGTQDEGAMNATGSNTLANPFRLDGFIPE